MKISVLRSLANRPLATQAMALTLVFLLSGLPAAAQVAQTTSQLGPKSLHIDILEGEGALNNIRTRDAREPVVQVTDENHKPVSGVAVVFLIHGGSSGGGATFAGGATSLTTTTGADGIAHAQGMQLGQSPGTFTISVSASLGSLAAATVIHQSNVITALNSAAKTTSNTVGRTVAQHGILHMSTTLAVTVGSAVVVGTVVGVVAATRSGGGTSLGLGPGTVGPPAP